MAKIKSAIYWRWLGWRPFAISAKYKACTNAWETFILKIEYIYWILKCQNTTTCLQISEIDSQNFFCNLNNRSFHLLAFSSKFRCRLLCLIPLKTNIFKKYKNSQKKCISELENLLFILFRLLWNFSFFHNERTTFVLMVWWKKARLGLEGHLKSCSSSWNLLLDSEW